MEKELTKHQNKLVKQAFNVVINWNTEKNLILYLHAPTGGGKTFMVSHIIQELCFNCDFTYIFIAPSTGSLSKQAYNAFRSYSKNREIEIPSENIHYIDGIDSLDSFFEKNHIYFIKWGSINNKKNILTREGGDRGSLFSVIRNTAKKNIQPIIIIDEEHLNVGRKSLMNNSKKILDSIDEHFKTFNTRHRQLLIRMSATPTFFQIKVRSFKNTDYRYLRMSYRDAVDDKLVKIKVKVLGLDTGSNENKYSQIDIDEKNVFKEFLDIAIKQYRHLKNEVHKVYNKHLKADLEAGVEDPIGFVDVEKREKFREFNPLVIIQLPDNTKKQKEKAYFERIYDHLIDRGFAPDQIACWLSDIKWIGKINYKRNIDFMKKQLVADNGKVSFLIFKQAIATGWDIPRATIYVKLRNITSKPFKIQTLGRVLRNPFFAYFKESHSHRSKSDLDYAYVSAPGRIDPIDVDSTSILMLEGAQKRPKSLFYKVPKTILNRELIDIEWKAEKFNALILNAFKKIRFVSVEKSIFTHLCSHTEENLKISIPALMDELLKKEIPVQGGVHLVSNIYEKNTIAERWEVRIIKAKRDIGFDDLEYLVEKRIRSLLGGSFTKLIVNFFMSRLFEEVKKVTPKITLKWWYLLLISSFFKEENDFYANDYFFIPEPYNDKNSYKTSIFKIIQNILLKKIIDFHNSYDNELAFFDTKNMKKNEFSPPTKIYLNDIDNVKNSENIANEERKNKVHYYVPSLWNAKRWHFLDAERRWEEIDKTLIQGKEEIESILWDSSFEKFFYSHLILWKNEYGINTVLRNQRDCFLDGEAFGIGYLKCAYPFIDWFEPDFIIIGKKNGITYQLICDTKGNLKSYQNETTYDDKAITKLVYSNKVYHKILASYNKNVSDDYLEVRTSITLIYQDYFKDQFYVVYYNENERKTKYLKLNKYIDLLVDLKGVNKKTPYIPYEIIKVKKPIKKMSSKKKMKNMSL